MRDARRPHGPITPPIGVLHGRRTRSWSAFRTGSLALVPRRIKAFFGFSTIFGARSSMTRFTLACLLRPVPLPMVKAAGAWRGETAFFLRAPIAFSPPYFFLPLPFPCFLGFSTMPAKRRVASCRLRRFRYRASSGT